MSAGVAHAEPPPAGPSPVRQGGKGTPDLGPPSWSVRLGPACWGCRGRDVDEGRVAAAMTANKNLKRRVRARAARTGESYAAALRHVRPQHQGTEMPETTPLRLATAQVTISEDPRDQAKLRQSGQEVRALMRQAGQAGARVIHFPEVFTEYERLDADVVLFSTTGAGNDPGATAAFATEAQAHAAANSLWVSFAVAAGQGPPAGIIAPDGRWAARCPDDGHPALAVAAIDNEPESRDIAVTKARPWRRLARAGIYDAHQVTDDRSEERTAF